VQLADYYRPVVDKHNGWTSHSMHFVTFSVVAAASVAAAADDVTCS